MLPMAPGAQQNNVQAATKNWNSNSMGHTMTHAQVNQKNKDRYMVMQQNREQHGMKQQFFMGSQQNQF